MMIKKITLVLSLLLTIFSWAQTGKIKMEISGIKNTKGVVSLALYNNANDFTKVEFQKATLKPSTGLLYANFDKLPAGTYAVAVLHDENKNKKMDFNMIGIPKEKYGFSRNPKLVLSAPKFKDVAFQIKDGETKALKIKMK